MSNSLKEISQISIYLKSEAERINEIALFQPLHHKSQFDMEKKELHQRVWKYTYNLPLRKRISFKIQKFLYKRFPFLIPPERTTVEAKFKTVLALLLAQEAVREFFLSDPLRRKDFFRAIEEVAHLLGYRDFALSSENQPLKISQQLTWFSEKKVSLIDDLVELNVQIAALNQYERDEILFRILNRVERPPITSVLEIMRGHEVESISITTKYAQYKIKEMDKKTGKVAYSCAENHATSSIKTMENLPPDAKGAMNQRVVFETNEGIFLGSYSGELSTPYHVLEQLLLLSNQKGNDVFILDQAPPEVLVEDKKILFTSLFSWHELGMITDQHTSIQKWDQKILKYDSSYFRLHLVHYNISFNALNKYPTPSETGAVIKDLNDEALIVLIGEVWKKLNLDSEKLEQIAQRYETLRSFEESAFLKKRTLVLEEIDRFRQLKKELISQLEHLNQTYLTSIVHALLQQKKPDGKILKGIDHLIFLDLLAKELGYIHNKNCLNSTDRSAGANAADKAQHVYKEVSKAPFLPGFAKEEELSLFKVLYSMYLVWEEPEITAALSTGFLGEKFYNNFFQKNPETTRYLMHWLKKHPEIYLGLSGYRT